MEAIWQLGAASVRDILNYFKGKKKPAYTTIMTVMARLHKKGILRRQFKNDAYIYTPIQNRENFSASMSKKIIHSLINEFGEEAAVAGFIDTLENSNIKKSKALRQKLKEIIK